MTTKFGLNQIYLNCSIQILFQRRVAELEAECMQKGQAPSGTS